MYNITIKKGYYIKQIISVCGSLLCISVYNSPQESEAKSHDSLKPEESEAEANDSSRPKESEDEVQDSFNPKGFEDTEEVRAKVTPTTKVLNSK